MDDILGARSDMVLWRATLSGTDRASGGPFELVHLHLRVFGADGLQTRLEFFDTDRDAEALARFDALTGSAPSAPFGAAGSRRPGRRRVRANATTAGAARLDAVMAARDADALADLDAEHVEVIDHPTGTTYDGAGNLASRRMLLKSRGPEVSARTLATLGESLASAPPLDISERGSRREVRRQRLRERDHHSGRLRRPRTQPAQRIFAVDRLGDAVVRLYERYAEMLPDGPARARAAVTARPVAALLGPPDRWPFAPDVEATDYRTVEFRVPAWRRRGAVSHPHPAANR
jgi:hypothetical protein